MPQTINVSDMSLKTIPIGRQGENEVNQITFDFTDWQNFFGEGAITLTLLRPNENTPYPIILTLEDTKAVWNVNSTDTAIKGTGKAQLIYTVNNQIKKSRVYNTEVFESLDDSTEPPDPYESWLTELLQIASEVQTNADAVEQNTENSLLYKNSAQRSAESAEASAESIQGIEETVRAYADSAETSATNASASESNASASESSARTYAETSTLNAQNAQNSANNASQSASDASASAELARQYAESLNLTFTDPNNDGNIVISLGGN